MQLSMLINLPHSFTLDAIEISEFSSYEQKRFFVTAYAGNLLEKSANPIHKFILPLKANLREPTGKRNSGLKSILRSISINPNHEIVSPIQVVCNSAKNIGNKQLLLEFNDEQGVLDGSHRLYALWKARNDGLDIRKVRVNFMITVGNIDIAARCTELNTYTAPSKVSLINKLGYFDFIKDIYRDRFPFIRYYDGQSGVSKSGISSIQAVESILLRSTGISKRQFCSDRGHMAGSLAMNKHDPDLSHGVRSDPKFWEMLYEVHPILEYTFRILEANAIKGNLRHVSVCNEFDAIQLPNGTRFNVRLSSMQLLYLLLSALSVNFDTVSYESKGVYSWHIPLDLIGKKLIRSALSTYRSKSTNRGYDGTASYCMSRPELAKAILIAAENRLSEYIEHKNTGRAVGGEDD